MNAPDDGEDPFGHKYLAKQNELRLAAIAKEKAEWQEKLDAGMRKLAEEKQAKTAEEITALVADPAALARRLLAIEAEIASLKVGLGALEDKRDRKPVVDQASFTIGQLSGGSMSAPELGLPPEPQRNRSGWVG